MQASVLGKFLTDLVVITISSWESKKNQVLACVKLTKSRASTVRAQTSRESRMQVYESNQESSSNEACCSIELRHSLDVAAGGPRSECTVQGLLFAEQRDASLESWQA